jgi:hypothetical protein
VVPLGDHQPSQQQARSPSVKTVTDQLRASMALPPSNSLLRQRPRSAGNRASVDSGFEDGAPKSASASPVGKARPSGAVVHTMKFDR